MKDHIIVTVDGEKIVAKQGSTIAEILSEEKYKDVIAANIEGDVVELSTELKKDTKLSLINFNSMIGGKIYRNGLKFIYIVAIKEIFGKNTIVRMKHSIDKGIYTELYINEKMNEAIVKKIKDKMLELVKKDLPIEKVSTLRRSAIEYFKANKELEKVENYKQISNGFITLYQLKDYFNYFYYFLPVSTGIIKYFDLTFIPPNGIVLRYPNNSHSIKIPPYTHMKDILKIFKDYEDRINKLDISYVSDVNKIISQGKINDFIQVNEMMHNDAMKEVADKIAKNKNIRVILIGGPSCSGKTTTAKKLELYLNAKGLDLFTISTDDYFLERKDNPKDENGNYNYEIIEAIDLDLFNRQLKDLISGKKVKMPTYNFIIGEKEYKSDPVKLKSNEIIIIEGLHTLNDRLTKDISKKNKFKIYASPFTPVALDRHNHVSTTDVRFLRRLVRDNARRGYDAEETLTNWKNMRAQEEEFVFPYQTEADAVINTALIYEVNALRVYAEPLLYSVDPCSPNYAEAIRLINFLKCFFSIPEENIPTTSVLREFIGQSYFE